MKKLRIHEAAKKLNISNKELMDFLKTEGYEFKSVLSSIETKLFDILKDHFGEEKKEELSKTIIKTKNARKKPLTQDIQIVEENIETLEKTKKISSVEDIAQPEVESKSKISTPKKEKVKEKPQIEKIKEKEKEKEKEIKKEIEVINDSSSIKDEFEKIIEIESDTLTVGELAQAAEMQVTDLIQKLMTLGIMANINQSLDFDTIEIICAEFNIGVTLKEPELDEIDENRDEYILTQVIGKERPAELNLEHRPPIITVMGHVDHGKTTLLDAIRSTNVTENEAGGITQHIGAYQVVYKGKKLTFLDTPGHAAFTRMRAHGAKITDIAILIVSADDGVMPQTVEALRHAQAAEIPIIVCINKIDKDGVNPDQIMQQLTSYNLSPEQWGGETIYVKVSAKNKINIEELLEMILLQAEMMELKADSSIPARGVVIEAFLDKGRGSIARVLINEGSLKVGDPIVIGEVYGKVRAMFNYKGEKIKKATPSMPVEILGLSNVPQFANEMFTIKSEKLARDYCKQKEIERKASLSAKKHMTLTELFHTTSSKLKKLNLIIKADVQGSVAAIKDSLVKLNNDEVEINVIHDALGPISENDVLLASASDAIILGFHVRPMPGLNKLIQREGVEVRLYKIIYEIINDITKAMEGMLSPDYEEIAVGAAQVKELFRVPKIGTIAGTIVVEGKVQKEKSIRIVRDGISIYEGKISSLRRFKDDVKEVSQGFECGIGIENYNDVKEGDILEIFEIKEIPKTIADKLNASNRQ